MGCVYLARNTVNGMCYIGKTVGTLRKRRGWHLATAARGEGWKFHRSIRKYGPLAFEWEVLARSDDDGELLRIEVEQIAARKTRDQGGYNLTEGGDGVVGRTPEVMAKIIAFHTGRKRSPETRRRLSEAMKGKCTRRGAVLSDTTRAKISTSLKGRLLTQITKAKIGAAFKGIPKSLEQREKMSRARKAWWDRKRDHELKPPVETVPRSEDQYEGE